MNMTLALSILVLAGGAVLSWGLDYELAGLDVSFIGAILIVFGTVGLLTAIDASARTRPARRPVRHD
jgi:hypothetical protein